MSLALNMEDLRMERYFVRDQYTLRVLLAPTENYLEAEQYALEQAEALGRILVIVREAEPMTVCRPGDAAQVRATYPGYFGLEPVGCIRAEVSREVARREDPDSLVERLTVQVMAEGLDPYAEERAQVLAQPFDPDEVD